MQARLACSLIYGLRTVRINARGDDPSYILKTQSNGWESLKVRLNQKNLILQNFSFFPKTICIWKSIYQKSKLYWHLTLIYVYEPSIIFIINTIFHTTKVDNKLFFKRTVYFSYSTI